MVERRKPNELSKQFIFQTVSEGGSVGTGNEKGQLGHCKQPQR